MRLRTRALRLTVVAAVLGALLVPSSSTAIASVEPDRFNVDVYGGLITCTDAAESPVATGCPGSFPGRLPNDQSSGASSGTFLLGSSTTWWGGLRSSCEAHPHAAHIGPHGNEILMPVMPCDVSLDGSLARYTNALTCARHRASGGTGILTIDAPDGEDERYTITDFGWTASHLVGLGPRGYGANARQVSGRFTRSSDGRTGDVSGVMLVSHNGPFLWDPVNCSARSIYDVLTQLVFTFDA